MASNDWWLVICVFSLVMMMSMAVRWYLIRRTMLLNAPTLLVTREEQRQQVFTLNQYPRNTQSHGFIDYNRYPVILESPQGVAYEDNRVFVNRTVYTNTGRVSGPPSYEQAMHISTTTTTTTTTTPTTETTTTEDPTCNNNIQRF